ncbi:unnamed protein product [Pseudo-nitzschia multistriata]|uniref:Smr domain-containing protein n=1 Tax=Pseudo-nitzschia multistriata TaxID=183589 RepID=A0A448ZAJ1_9STRA|nr:unnamed protein product [Pseudo-nitzschia multistriata]
MGNCFGLFSAVESHTRPPVAAPPAKRRRKEQPFVTEEVLEIRMLARKYHEKVVECAKNSQEAYQKGDKKKAHTLSEEKKDWQKKQNDANIKAAKLILEPQSWQTSGEIDLHGLFLQEATNATLEFLKYWSKKVWSDAKIVLIITGAGHHSENHKAVIRPHVEQILQEQHLDYKSVHGNGAFEITLKPRQ